MTLQLHHKLLLLPRQHTELQKWDDTLQWLSEEISKDATKLEEEKIKFCLEKNEFAKKSMEIDMTFLF